MRLEDELYALPDVPEANERAYDLACRIWGEETARRLWQDRIDRQNRRGASSGVSE